MKPAPTEMAIGGRRYPVARFFAGPWNDLGCANRPYGGECCRVGVTPILRAFPPVKGEGICWRGGGVKYGKGAH